jgi:hypothetical protein
LDACCVVAGVDAVVCVLATSVESAALELGGEEGEPWSCHAATAATAATIAAIARSGRTSPIRAVSTGAIASGTRECSSRCA